MSKTELTQRSSCAKGTVTSCLEFALLYESKSYRNMGTQFGRRVQSANRQTDRQTKNQHHSNNNNNNKLIHSKPAAQEELTV
jgi:hypothetical protein